MTSNSCTSTAAQSSELRKWILHSISSGRYSKPPAELVQAIGYLVSCQIHEGDLSAIEIQIDYDPETDFLNLYVSTKQSSTYELMRVPATMLNASSESIRDYLSSQAVSKQVDEVNKLRDAAGDLMTKLMSMLDANPQLAAALMVDLDKYPSLAAFLTRSSD